MKNRFLPLGLITACLGLSLLLISVVSMAGQPGNPDLKKIDRSWWESIRANQNSGQINPQDVINARQQSEMLRIKSSSVATGLNWQSLGPDNYPGLVWSAIFDNTDPSGLTIISGSASGGIWKSIDLGLTWVQMPVENNQDLKVSSLVQTANGTIYAATGILNCNADAYNGTGIYRSVSGGAFGVIAGTLINPDFARVAKLIIDPQSGRLFAATKSGLYYSDNGDQWTIAKSGGLCMDVCVGSDGTIITAVGDSAYMAPAGNINGWVTLTTGAVDALPNSGIGWMVFAIAPSDGNVMYASLAGTDFNLLNVYCSTDKGATWSVVFPKNTSFDPYKEGMGCYSNTIAVLPTDPYKLYIGGVNMWYGQKILSTGFYNWEKVSFGSFGDLSPFYAPSYHHSYAFRPNSPNQLVMGTDGGVSIATIGIDGVTFQTSNKNLKTSQFNSLSYSAQKGYVMGGGNRIGTLVMGYFAPSQVSFPSDGYQVWREDASALGANAQPQPSNFCGNGGTCEWSSIDSRVAVYTQQGTLKIRRQDFTDINYANTFFSKGVNFVASDHMPMGLWETFNQGNVFGVTRDSVKYHAEQKGIPADTTIMALSNCNKVPFPYHTMAPIPKGDSLTIADPLASRFFIFGDTSNVKGIYMTKDMLKMNKVTPEYFLIFKDKIATDIPTALTVSADLNVVWVGTTKGRLIRITGLIGAYDSATANIASSQTVLVDTVYSNTPFTGRSVTSISIDPGNTNRVLVTLGNYGNQDYVFYSQNANDPAPLFTSIQGDLPKAPVYSGLLEMHGNTVILGTDLGVFTTTTMNTGSPQWAPDMQNIGDVPVTSVRQQVIRDYHILNYGVVYISSYGRGIWMDTTYSSPVGIEPVPGVAAHNGTLILSPNPVNDILYISYTNETSERLNLTVYDLSGRVLLNSSLGNQPKGKITTTINVGSLSHGTYIVQVGNSHGKIVKL